MSPFSKGALQSVETAKKVLWTPSSGALSAVENEKAALMALTDQLQAAAAALPPVPDETDWMAYFAAQQALLDAAHPLAQSLHHRYQQLRTTRLIAANQAIAQNTGITLDNSNIWQANDRTINEIYLSAVAKEQGFSEQQVNDLIAIAIQCPSEGGDAVYRARVMLAGAAPDKEFSNPEKCGEEDIKDRSAAIRTDTKRISLNIQPNPASDKVTVSVILPVDYSGKLQVIDIMGRVTEERPINDTKTLYFDTTNWHKGIYVCVLTDKYGRQTDFKRLIIQ